MKNSLLLSILLSICFSTLGQNSKQFFKAGKKFSEINDFTNAIEQYTQAIKLDPNYEDAYLERAYAFEKNKQLKEAVSDFDKLISLEFNDEIVYFSAAKICYELEDYNKGLKFVKLVLEERKVKFDAYLLQTQMLLKTEDYSNAIASADIALNLQETAELHYYKALAFEATNFQDIAESEYHSALRLKPNYIEALLGLATLELELNKLDKALVTSNKAVATKEKGQEAYLIRSRVYAALIDYPSAINDMSRNIMLNPNNADLYLIRGTYYQEFTQHQNAINDFNKVILMDKTNVQAYYKRAYSYEQIANYNAAIKDYTKLTELQAYDGNAQELLDKANVRLFELNRESNKPQIVITHPTPVNTNEVNYAKNLNEIEITGTIIDASAIKAVKINDVNIPFEKEEKTFKATIGTVNTETFIVKAIDAYDNVSETTFKLHKTEVDAPVVALLAPYSSDNGEIFLDSDNNTLYIEGNIKDESAINSIFIDGVTASFKMNDIKPRFMATIDISNKNSFTVSAKDIHGNQVDQVYKLNRDGISLLKNNPMGRTWAIFIENSNYINFPSLDGPGQDVTLMRSALTQYDIHNIIHKKDMSKADMERFFQIELRDLVKSNGVSSVLVWYAGHGKFVNDVGYWIPVDANRNDEYSYYSINQLKASLQVFNDHLEHTLLITDACESGPTFYQAMRSEITERNCGDWQASKLKSSQVFTSAGYELALDNSQFTKTFANMLSNNPNSCIPIESIVIKVTQAVSANNQQSPKFGKIAGLSDENGTFFFISKDSK